MNGKKAKAQRRQAETQSVGLPDHAWTVRRYKNAKCEIVEVEKPIAMTVPVTLAPSTRFVLKNLKRKNRMIARRARQVLLG